MQTMEFNHKIGKVGSRQGSYAATCFAVAPDTRVRPRVRRREQICLGGRTACTEPKPAHEVNAGGSLDVNWAADREQMIAMHLPTVRRIARRIHERLPQHVELQELVAAGVLGLVDALSKFDSTKGVQFQSYAQFRIRGAIFDSLRTLDWSPRNLRRKGRAVEEAIRAVTARQGRPAAESEVAAELHLGLGDYQQLLGELKGLEIGTLHTVRSEDSGEEELAYLPGRPDDDPLFQCLRGEMQQQLADAVAALPERERLVMTLYYYEDLTMLEIGAALGVVESRVSQIHSSAVLHLRSKLTRFSLPVANVKRAAANPLRAGHRSGQCIAFSEGRGALKLGYRISAGS